MIHVRIKDNCYTGFRKWTDTENKIITYLQIY